MAMHIPGTIAPFAGELDPSSYLCTSGLGLQDLYFGPNPRNNTGWILCDGSTFSLSLFPHLFQVIGNAYRTKSSGSPQVPNYQGYFFRGLSTDSSSNANVDRSPYSSDSTFKVGSTQEDMVILHSHHAFQESTGTGEEPSSILLPTPPQKSKAQVFTFPSSGKGPPTPTKVSGEETRPVNIYVNYLIYAGLPAH